MAEQIQQPSSLTESACIQRVGMLISSHSFNFMNEIQLQDGLEQLFKEHKIPYVREFRLSNKDIVDFMIDFQAGSVALEVKIDGTRSSLLRQIGRYLKHDTISCVFLVGTPYWVTNMPKSLLNKQIYCHRILRGIS